MTTKILTKEFVSKAAALIASGELVAFPTETVYGLGANALDETAVKKIFEAKGRPQDNPLIVHICDVSEAERIAEVSEIFYRLAERFMPGPLTAVLKKKDIVPDIVSAGLDTVAVRIPDNAIALEIIRLSGCPVAAPSANISTHVSPTSAQHVYDDLGGRIPLIIDGGECGVGIESTVLDLTSDKLVILRPGAVTAEMLKEIDDVTEYRGEVVKAKSPGMKYKHYAPNAKLYLCKTAKEINTLYNEYSKNSKCVILAKSDVERFDGNIIDIGNTSKEFSRNIYRALRDAEKDYDVIICEAPDDDALGKSIMNRVEKAAKENNP
jgi:L-threonylcarbamoyladenylate synthase